MVGVRGFEPPAPASRRQCFLLGLTINQPHTHSDPARMWLKTTQMDWNGQMLVTFWSQCRHLCAVIQGEEAPRITAADATRTLAATLAVFDSAQTEKQVVL